MVDCLCLSTDFLAVLILLLCAWSILGPGLACSEIPIPLDLGIILSWSQLGASLVIPRVLVLATATFQFGCCDLSAGYEIARKSGSHTDFIDLCAFCRLSQGGLQLGDSFEPSVAARKSVVLVFLLDFVFDVLEAL